jgi:hypothetical protein
MHSASPTTKTADSYVDRPVPGVSVLTPSSPSVDKAAASLATWLRTGGSFLRDLQWVRPSAAGELLALPACFNTEVGR